MGNIPILWPEDVSEGEPSLTPYAILKQQASALAERTRGELEGQVRRNTDEDGDFVYSFRIAAAGLNYSYELFTAWHSPVLIYPVYGSFSGRNVKCDNQQEFFNWLSQVLGSEETKRVITSLRAQLKE